LLAHAGLAGRIFPHYLGRGEAFRLATATAMEGPVLRAFNRYQLFWSSVWSDVTKVVLWALETYGGMTFETMETEVNLDPVIQLDLDDIDVVNIMLTDMMDRGMITTKQGKEIGGRLLRVAMGKLGMTDVSELLFTDAEDQKEEEGEDEEDQEEGDDSNQGGPSKSRRRRPALTRRVARK